MVACGTSSTGTTDTGTSSASAASTTSESQPTPPTTLSGITPPDQATMPAQSGQSGAPGGVTTTTQYTPTGKSSQSNGTRTKQKVTITAMRSNQSALLLSKSARLTLIECRLNTAGDSSSGTTITSIVGNGHTVTYDSSLAANSYLGGKTYTLVNGGTLSPK